MDESKFIFCDTPASLIVRLDLILHCPVWLEELKQDGNNNLYQLIELPEEYRTPQLKMFHATQAILSENWKQLSTHLIAAHMAATYPQSRLVIMDSYPMPMIQTAAVKMAEQIARLIPTYKPSAVETYYADGIDGYNTQLLSVQANDKEFKRVSFNFSEKKLADFVPTIDNYNEALDKYHTAQAQLQSEQAAMNPRFKPYIVKPDDDGQGGILQ